MNEIMRFLKTAAYILIFIFYHFSASAQEIPACLEEMMNIYGVDAVEISMPADYYNAPLNLKFNESMLPAPYSALEFSGIFADKFSNIDSNYNFIFPKIFQMLEFRPYESQSFQSLLPRSYLEERLNCSFDSIPGVSSSALLRQYISPMLLINDILDKDLFMSSNTDIRFLLAHAEDILKLQKDSSNPRFAGVQANILDTFFQKAQYIRGSSMFNLGTSLLHIYKETISKNKVNLDLIAKDVQTKVIETSYGKIAIGGTGDDTYNGNFALIIDLGGSDTYVSPQIDKNEMLLTPVRCIIDFNGNDAYIGEDYCFGSGYFGIGMVIDMAGNDSYSAGSFSLGSALFGFGLLLDEGGSDIYKGNDFSQGSAAFGVGILHDRNSNDIYHCRQFSQGFGFTSGIGILSDVSGDDSYQSSKIGEKKIETKLRSYSQGAALGLPGRSCGGIGIIFDHSGSDKYLAELYSQSYADCKGFAVFHDSGGGDYFQNLGLSMASADNNAFSYFMNKGGEDIYQCAERTASPDDFSCSVFYDPDGADKYLLSENLEFSSLNSLRIYSGNGDNVYFYNSSSAKTLPGDTEKCMLDYSIARDLNGMDAERYLANLGSSKIFKGPDAVISALQKINAPDSASIPIIDHPDWRVRFHAAEYLGAFGDPAEIIPLLKKFTGDENKYVKAKAAYYYAMREPRKFLEDHSAILLSGDYLPAVSVLRAYTGIEGLSSDIFLSLLVSEMNMGYKLKVAAAGAHVEENVAAARALRGEITKLEVILREEYYKGLINSESDFWKSQIKYFVKREKDENLKKLLEENIDG